MRKFHIGTAGWSYLKWDKGFYPKGTKAADKLAYYSSQFNAVELNNSFYHLPKAEQFLSWEAMVPKAFQFAVKAPQYITHTKKLKNIAEPLQDLMKVTSRQKKPGPIFFQLPPSLTLDLERLNLFLKQLPKDIRCTIEFRHTSWHDEKVYEALEQSNVAFCLYDTGEDSSPSVLTADFTYLRIFGRSAKRLVPLIYKWRDWLKERSKENYVFFHNHLDKSLAFGSAQRFRDLVGEDRQ